MKNTVKASNSNVTKKPNIVFVFADQWRQQATGFNGDCNVKTPNLDALAQSSINLTNAVSSCPVCTPYRASLLTGQFPLTHGLFTNDVPLNPEITGLGDAFKAGGYNTAYIGKWHVDGQGRQTYIPPERRKGFDYWKVLECTHRYENSPYYSGDSTELKYWDGYDAIAQTKDACQYLADYAEEEPFLLVLSWGPPHDQNVTPKVADDWYFGAPPQYRALYDEHDIKLRPNVLSSETDAAKKLEGYYAHCTALDDCMGDLLATLESRNMSKDTIVVFTSDHGDMLGSHGKGQKQAPWEESIRVPFLLRYPALFGEKGESTNIVIDAPDIMPTLLGLAELDIPDSVEGINYQPHLLGEKDMSDEPALIACYDLSGSGYYTAEMGGRDYRGLRTKRYTYVREINGPWLLFDNESDLYQLNNIINTPAAAEIQQELDELLNRKLQERNDEFLSGSEYREKWGYQ
jgi:arylsulfatase A-like enzyme